MAGRQASPLRVLLGVLSSPLGVLTSSLGKRGVWKSRFHEVKLTANPGNWTIMSGNCVVDHNCMMSPNFPHLSESNDSCEFSAADSFVVTASAFNTERYYDTLTVNKVEFSGDCGPWHLLAEGQILWSTDGTQRSSGWKLCQEERPLQWLHVMGGR